MPAAPPAQPYADAGVMPVPYAPSYDPAALAQPYSAPPVLGPYGYAMPVSALPVAAPPRRGRVGTVILAVISTLLLAAGGVLGTLYVQKNQEGQRLAADLAALTDDHTAQKKDLDTAQRQLTDTRNDLNDSEEQVTEITSQKAALGECINAIYDYWEALFTSNGRETADVRAKSDAVDVECSEADKFLSVAR
jgi:hypothetical protein